MVACVDTVPFRVSARRGPHYIWYYLTVTYIDADIDASSATVGAIELVELVVLSDCLLIYAVA